MSFVEVVGVFVNMFGVLGIAPGGLNPDEGEDTADEEGNVEPEESVEVEFLGFGVGHHVVHFHL